MKTFEMQVKSRLLLRQASLRERADRGQGGGPHPGEPPLSPEEAVELEDVGRALRKLEDGRYGQCECCGRGIGRQRLTAIPEARVCVACTEAVLVGTSA